MNNYKPLKEMRDNGILIFLPLNNFYSVGELSVYLQKMNKSFQDNLNEILSLDDFKANKVEFIKKDFQDFSKFATSHKLGSSYVIVKDIEKEIFYICYDSKHVDKMQVVFMDWAGMLFRENRETKLFMFSEYERTTLSEKLKKVRTANKNKD